MKEQELMLAEDETLDDLQNGYFILQAAGGFRFGMDAVLLADFAQVRPGEKVLDLGTGNGILPILLAAKTRGQSFTGLEIQERSADLAERSVRYNHLEDRIRIVRGDLKEAESIFGSASFEVVVSNPPYMIGQHGLTNTDDAKKIARHEVTMTFRALAQQAAAVLKENGRLFLVHRPFRLAEIMKELMEVRLEPKRMRLVHPYADREPNMVLLEARKGGNSRITVEKPLVVYERPGIYTREILEIYGMEEK